MPNDLAMKLRRERFDTARQQLRVRWQTLVEENRVSLWVFEHAKDLIPSVFPALHLQWFPAWLANVEEVAANVNRISQSISWLDTLAGMLDAGLAELQPSESKPGDLDLWINADVIMPAPPEGYANVTPGLQLEAFGAFPILAVVGIVALVLAFGYTTDVLTEKERTVQRELDRNIASDLIRARGAGDISEQDLVELRGLVNGWKSVQKTSAASDLERILKTIAIAAAVIGGIGLTVQIVKLVKGD